MKRDGASRVWPIWRAWCVLLLLALGFPAHAESLLIGGTGSAEPILTILFAEFAKQAPTIQARVINPALGSGLSLIHI
jgi:hypothetical protein